MIDILFMRFLANARNDSTRLSIKVKYGGEAAILNQPQRRLVVISNGVRNLNNCCLFLDLGVLRMSIFILTLFFTQTSIAQHQTALRSHVNHLSSPLLQGRLTGSWGQKLAAIYIQNKIDSVLVDTYEVKQIKHSGWLYDGVDTLYYKHDFFYSGIRLHQSGKLSLDSVSIVFCSAEELFNRCKQNQSSNTIYILSNWADFLDLFGHEFSSKETILTDDIKQEPLQLFINQEKWNQSKKLEYSLVNEEDTWFTENLICPVYYHPNNTSTWIFSAHYDHLGKSNSSYFAGADDNASGVALLLELASLIKNSEYQFPMNITFAFFSAEEQGLLGSRYFVEYSPFFSADITRCLNFDMVGFVKNNNIQLIHYQDSVWLNFSNSQEIELESISQEAFLHEFSSDHQSFVDKGIPAVMFFSGLHEFYHSPEDTPEKLNYDAMNALVKLIYGVLEGN